MHQVCITSTVGMQKSSTIYFQVLVLVPNFSISLSRAFCYRFHLSILSYREAAKTLLSQYSSH